MLTIQRSTQSCAAALNPDVPETKASALTDEKPSFDRRLHRDADRNSDVQIPAVGQVIAFVDVGHVNNVGVVPVVRPVLWPRVNSAEPIALVREARIRDTPDFFRILLRTGHQRRFFINLPSIDTVWRALAKMRQAPRSSARQNSSVEHLPSQRLCPCTSCWTQPTASNSMPI